MPCYPAKYSRSEGQGLAADAGTGVAEAVDREDKMRVSCRTVTFFIISCSTTIRSDGP